MNDGLECGSIDDTAVLKYARVKFVEGEGCEKRAPFPRYDRGQDTRGWFHVRFNENRLVPRETNYVRECHVPPCIRLHFRAAERNEHG